MRGVAAVVAGLVIGLIALVAFGFVGGLLFPPEPGAQIAKGADLGVVFAALPTGAKVAAVLSWAAGAFFGGLVAKLIARRGWAAWTVALVYLLLAAGNMVLLPMPGWLKALGIIGPIAGGLLAGMVPVRAPADPLVEDELEEEDDGARP